MNVQRVWVIAQNVFREVIRDRILYLIGFFAVILVVISLLLPQISANTQDKILLDVGMAGIAIAGLVTAVFVGTGLVNKEIEKRTVFVLIAKPISRVEFIVGKHLGLTAVLAVLITAMTVIYFGVLSFHQVTYPIGSLAIASFYTLLELSLVTAIAILFGVFTSSLMSTILTFAMYVMGHLSSDLVELAKLAKNPSLEQLTENMYLVLPDLSRLNLRNAAVYGSELMPEPTELLSSGIYAIAYIVLLLTIANLIFSRRQF
ncbi:MAG: ABC transporter permease [Cyanobacteria bacterium P01_F01_bin.150]